MGDASDGERERKGDQTINLTDCVPRRAIGMWKRDETEMIYGDLGAG